MKGLTTSLLLAVLVVISTRVNSSGSVTTEKIRPKPNPDTIPKTSIHPSTAPPTTTTNAIPISKIQSCVPGNITKLDIQLEGGRMVVRVSPNSENISYDLKTNQAVDRTETNTNEIIFYTGKGVTQCATVDMTLITNFCENNEIKAQFESGILNEKVLSGIQVSNIRVIAKSNSTMEVDWIPPILRKQCVQYKLNYTIRWFPLGKQDTEGTIRTDESRYSIAVKEYDQSYTVCVTVSVISNRGKSYERVEKGNEVCDGTEKSSPGKPSSPIVKIIEPTTNSIGITFENPLKPNGNIKYFEYTYCEGQNCAGTNWVVNAAKNLTLIDLLPCTEYEVKIRAVNEDVDGTAIPGEINVTSATTKTVEPSVITDLRGSAITETSLNVTWDAISTRCAVNYAVTLTTNSNCYAETINTTGNNTTMLFDNVKPYTRYNVNVTATNEAGSKYNDTLVLQTGYGAPEKPNVTGDCSSTACDFKWTIPPQLPGPISYSIDLRKTTDDKIVVHCVRNVTVDNVTDCSVDIRLKCQFEDLEPYTKYNWSISATVGSEKEFQFDHHSITTGKSVTQKLSPDVVEITYERVKITYERKAIVLPEFKSDASKITSEGTGLTRAYLHEQNQFTVNAQNAGDNILYVGVIGPENPSEEVIIRHIGRNNYRVNYVIKDRGDHILSVRWGDENIPGSPFKVKVR